MHDQTDFELPRMVKEPKKSERQCVNGPQVRCETERKNSRGARGGQLLPSLDPLRGIISSHRENAVSLCAVTFMMIAAISTTCGSNT